MVIAFDGICILCNRFVAFLLRHDHAATLRFTINQSPYGAEIFARTGQNPAEPVSVIAVDGDHIHTESDAAIAAIAALGGTWRLVRAARLVPRPLRDAAYRFVAARRYRWFGKLDTCPLPDPRFTDRFLT